MASNSLYLRLYSTTLINTISDAIAAVVLPLAFLAQTGSVSLAASLAAATTLPAVVLSVPLGALADRIPRRPAVVLAYLVEAICLIVLGVLLWTGYASFWPIVAIGATRGIFSQLGNSGAAGYVPQLLGRDALLRYNSRIETIEGVAAIGGPPVAGGIVAVLGGSFSLFFPAVSSLVNGAIYYFLPDVPNKNDDDGESEDKPRNFFAQWAIDIFDGLRFVFTDKVIAPIILVQLALGTTTSSYVFGIVTHLDKGLGFSPYLAGLIMAAAGVGGITASLVMEKIFPIERSKFVLLMAFTGVGLVLSLFCFITNGWLAAVALFALDFCWSSIFIYAGTLEQCGVEDNLLARVDSISSTVFYIGSVLASGMAAWVIPNVGTEVFMLLCVATVLPALIGLMRLPSTLTIVA